MTSSSGPASGPEDPSRSLDSLPPSTALTGLSRSQFLRRGLAAGAALSAVGLVPEQAFATRTRPEAPHLPRGFSDIFTSRYVNAGAVRLHAVVGGEGPPLLLVHGWPQNWYQWRLIMPALAQQFRVIAVDQRGMGLSQKPPDGYDTGTLARDLVGLMDALGHERFALAGFDTGLDISYALAADYRGRVERLVVGEAPIPGVTTSPPLFVSSQYVPVFFHLLFNRLTHMNVDLVRGRESIFFGFVFDAEAANKLPEYAVLFYIDGFASSREALTGSFRWYRAWDATTAQNLERIKRKLSVPVLAIGGQFALGEGVAETMRLVASDVQGLVIPGSGHFIAEEAPEAVLAALTTFLAPYRDGHATRATSRRAAK
jgi:pimeloyl-ACP methyl ester carboxylesterase